MVKGFIGTLEFLDIELINRQEGELWETILGLKRPEISHVVTM